MSKADGLVVIAIELEDGKIAKGVANLNKQLEGLNKPALNFSQKLNAVGESMRRVGAVGKPAIAAVAAGVGALSAAVISGIKRFDTLNASAKSFENMGISKGVVKKEMDSLKNALDGLPTPLDAAVSGVQIFTGVMNNNLPKANKVWLALNNSILAFGGTAENADRATIQLSQSFANGKVDAQTWISMMNANMGPTLNAMAKQMGITTGELRSGLADGTIAVENFQDSLVELNEKGGGGLASLEKMAKDATSGIGTNLANLKNALNKLGVKILENIGSDNINKAFKLIREVIAELGDRVAPKIGEAFKKIIPFMSGVAGNADKIVDAILKFAPVVGVVAGVSIAFMVLGKMVTTAGIAMKFFMTEAGNLSKVNVTIAAIYLLVNAFMIAYANSETLRNGISYLIERFDEWIPIVIGLATAIGIVSIALKWQAIYYVTVKTALLVMMGATQLATAAQTAFAAVTAASIGPVVLVAAAIAVLVGVAVSLFNIFDKGAKDAKKARKEMKELRKETNDLTKEIKDGEDAYKKQQGAMEANRKVTAENVKQIKELADKEKLSAAEKVLLKQKIDEVNQSVDGLNLAYDEQSGKLNKSNDELDIQTEKLGKVTDAHTKLGNAESELGRLSEAHTKLVQQIAEEEAAQDKLKSGMEASSYVRRADARAMEESEKTLATLNEKLAENATQQNDTAQVIADAQGLISASVEESHDRVVVSYEILSEQQKAIIDKLNETAQSFKDNIVGLNSEIDLSNQKTAEQWRVSMEKNAQVMSDWANNISSLSGRVSADFLGQLQQMGPDGARLTADMVNMSDAEIAKMEEAFRNATDTATKAATAGIDNATLPDDVRRLVSSTTESMSQAVKNADFTQIGKDINDGVKSGIESSGIDVSKSTENVAKEAQQAFQKTNDSKSPSKVYKGFGKDMMDGLIGGILDNGSKIVEAMKQTASQLKPPFEQLPNALEIVGASAMIGFNNGLVGQAGVVYSTAQTIANNVAKVMRDALEVKSPSRVFKRIGQMVSDGFAIGILDNITSTVRAMERMNDIVLDTMTPEMVVTGNYPELVGGTNTSMVRNVVNHFNFSDITWNNRDDIEQTMKEIANQMIIDERGAFG